MGPQISERTFEFYFPETWRDLQDAENDPGHPDHGIHVIEPPKPKKHVFPALGKMEPIITHSKFAAFISYWHDFTAETLLVASPLFAFKMAIRHRLFPMASMSAVLPQVIKDQYPEDLKNPEVIDAEPYGRGTAMFMSKEMSTEGWRTLLTLLARQTDSDEEKLLIQNHEGAPFIELVKFFIKSEQKFGVSQQSFFFK
jgi:hypothetical protein